MKDIFKVGFVPMFQNKGLNDVNITTLDTNSVPEENVTAQDFNSVPEGYVDLGLPSGTLWATCNLGTSKPEEYGKYYQWGDTIGYTGNEAIVHSYWKTTPFNDGSNKFDWVFFDKHRYRSDWLTSDGVLKPEYDAAYKATNGLAHMPTKEQIKELTLCTANMWVENYNGSGINGRVFISKRDLDKHIFIPTAGRVDEGCIDSVGYSSGIWSSNLRFFDPGHAHFLYISSHPAVLKSFFGRNVGQSIRGVIGQTSRGLPY